MDMSINKKLKVCIVTYPLAMAGITPLSNLTECLSKLSGSIYLITGNGGTKILNARPGLQGYAIDFKTKTFLLKKIWDHVMLQTKITYRILRVNAIIDLYVYFMGESLVLPTLLCKLLRKPIIWVMAGSVSKIYENDASLAAKIFVIEAKLSYKLADKMVIYSKKLIEEWKLEKYKTKILIAHEHYLDLEKFNNYKLLAQRDILVGYIGRLSEEKGILNFIKAIPKILKTRDDINFVVGGNGGLKNEIEKYLYENRLYDKVKLMGWISHEDLPGYLNNIKLLVLPSYTEGLPNIMLEAMACGTPVLAISSGAIPDIIRDEYTGFIMIENSPECIAKNVLRALNHSGLEQIPQNGRALVEHEFTCEKAIEGYSSVLDNIVREKFRD